MAPSFLDDPLPDLGGLVILLAEDNETNQIVAGEMLRAMGAEVEIAADGAEALERAAGRPYDVLVVDIEMPRISGEDVIRLVRAADEPLASRPLIALTAYPREDVGARLLAAGADEVLSKPIDGIAAFGRAILAPLENRRAPRAAPDAPEAMELAAVAAEASGFSPRTLDCLLRSVGPGMMIPLLDRLIEDIEAAAGTVRLASAPVQPEALRRAGHVLTAVAGSAGAGALAQRAEAMHAAAAAGDLDAALAAAPPLLREADAALARLRAVRQEAGA
ncbi:response regulator [Rhodovulum sp. DZ06]|uniref:response regulator n=1 Tax=Rhodovulum sp. DZ06 TaxID=3425126 RepID=UPI003D346A6B